MIKRYEKPNAAARKLPCKFCGKQTSFIESLTCGTCYYIRCGAQEFATRPEVIVALLMDAGVPPLLLADAVTEVLP